MIHATHAAFRASDGTTTVDFQPRTIPGMVAILLPVKPHTLIQIKAAFALTGITALTSAGRLVGVLDVISDLATFDAE